MNSISKTESSEERVVVMRLQKFLARGGAASRRGSENLMTAGRVTVNGQVVTELGSKVDPRIDEVAVDGVVVRLSDAPVTLMLHKPVGYVTTMSDPQGRKTVADLVPLDRYPGLFPIGRLDFDTTGLLLFSTDGDLGNRLLHPRHHVRKTYEALVEGIPTPQQLAALRRGVELEDGMSAPAVIETLRSRREDARNTSRLSIGIHEGRKRQVRRMGSAIGHEVVELHRAKFGPLELGDLPCGSWRLLSDGELAALCAASDEQC
ncbi:MAG: pseudouridine synthase [Raoultibacter sp.]